MELTICLSIIIHSILLIFSLFTIISIKKNDYVRFGSHKNLTLVNINVDTHDIYIATIIGISLLRFTHILLKRLGNRYIEYIKQEETDKVIIGRAFWISSTIYYAQSLSFFIIVKAFITQLDYAIIPILTSELLFFPFNYYSLKKNKPTGKNIDITTINPIFSKPELCFENIYDDNETCEKKIEFKNH
jgi:hypothetical protein